MKRAILPTALLFALAAPSSAQPAQPPVGENPVKVSDHVWALMGFPNIGIVVGTRATLVVDTGLGPANGATAARVAMRLSGGSKLFLTTTHFHPEHAGGEPGFPATTVLVRNAAQQQEMNEHGAEMLDLFRGQNARNAQLLAGVTTLRTPDVTFDRDLTLDLGGGVTARLLWFGGAHTKGDEVVLVEPDGTLISGDVVQNRVVPAIFGDGGTPSSWLGVLDQIARLKIEHVLPDHSPVGDGSLVASERAFIDDLRTRALALKQQGIPADEAGRQLSAAFKAKYADWPNMNVGGFVQRIYTENP